MEALLDFLKELPCEVCLSQSVERRLHMEVSAARALEALRRAGDEDLRLAELALRELRLHRQHTAFFKVVAKDSEGFLSVYDGATRYALGRTVFDRQQGGFYVHCSEEQAKRSMQCFPRQSAAWGVPRTILLVRRGLERLATVFSCRR